jgi:4'-phosphopantetheinyl transferase
MELAQDEVHCWYVRMDVSAGTCAALSATLSHDERIRCARMRSPQLQQRFIAAHGALRELLGRYLGAHPSEVQYVHNEFGKPALSGQFGGRLTFNLSHSADLALIGIAADAQIGVDLEHIRDEPEFSEIAHWFFAAAEVEELHRLPSELRTRAFLSSWTRKEAYAKARGQGLGATNEIAQQPGWSLYSLQPAPRYVGALVVEGSGRRVTERFMSLDAQLTQAKPTAMSNFLSS